MGDGLRGEPHEMGAEVNAPRTRLVWAAFRGSALSVSDLTSSPGSIRSRGKLGQRASTSDWQDGQRPYGSAVGSTTTGFGQASHAITPALGVDNTKYA